jgi:hypothetical protein
VPAPAVRPVRDAIPRPPVPARVVNMPRPGTTPAPAPRPTPAPTPAPARTGTADSMARSVPATPALPDLSGVDFAALGRYIVSQKKPAPKPAPKPATTRVNPVSVRLR